MLTEIKSFPSLSSYGIGKQYIYLQLDGKICSKDQLRCRRRFLWEPAKMLFSDRTVCQEAGPCIRRDHVNSPSSAVQKKKAENLGGKKLFRLF